MDNQRITPGQKKLQHHKVTYELSNRVQQLEADHRAMISLLEDMTRLVCDLRLEVQALRETASNEASLHKDNLSSSNDGDDYHYKQGRTKDDLHMEGSTLNRVVQEAEDPLSLKKWDFLT